MLANASVCTPCLYLFANCSCVLTFMYLYLHFYSVHISCMFLRGMRTHRRRDTKAVSVVFYCSCGARRSSASGVPELERWPRLGLARLLWLSLLIGGPFYGCPYDMYVCMYIHIYT